MRIGHPRPHICLHPFDIRFPRVPWHKPGVQEGKGTPQEGVVACVFGVCSVTLCDVDVAGGIGNKCDNMSLPILPDVQWNLGLAGTLGGSVGAQELDASDPDSDIPDELQVILSSLAPKNDDTMSFKPNTVITHSPLPLPGLPPEMPLPLPKGSIPNVPVFCISVVDEDDHHVDIEEAEMSSEDDTKKSFDFTGELKKLNESGGSDRLSFVKQLENMFRTPANL
jgi:serine/arginine repetitive matrix protein 2